jgi:hypothetical protein
MSLEKITGVYRGAYHVLVLGSSSERIKSEELSGSRNFRSDIYLELDEETLDSSR